MTPNTREELIKELRMVANMINMGERIQWGRETTLMDRSADMLETLHQELQKAREEERERIKQISLEAIRGEWTETNYLLALTQPELDQPNK